MGYERFSYGDSYKIDSEDVDGLRSTYTNSFFAAIHTTETIFIIGAVAGIIILVVVVACIVCIVRRRRRSSKSVDGDMAELVRDAVNPEQSPDSGVTNPTVIDDHGDISSLSEPIHYCNLRGTCETCSRNVEDMKMARDYDDVVPRPIREDDDSTVKSSEYDYVTPGQMSYINVAGTRPMREYVNVHAGTIREYDEFNPEPIGEYDDVCTEAKGEHDYVNKEFVHEYDYVDVKKLHS